MKRFTETEKWRDVWYRKLTPVQKCLWNYLCDNCDQSGVIDIDLELAGFQIGQPIQPKDLQAFSRQIETLPSGKLWIRGFVRFQYGKLSEACKPHIPVFAALKKNGLCIEDVEQNPKFTEKVEGYLRDKIIARDGLVCAYFNTPVSIEDARIDHVIPRAQGGTKEPNNLVVASSNANIKKGELSVEEFCKKESLDLESVKARISERLSKPIPVGIQSLQDKDKDKEQDGAPTDAIEMPLGFSDEFAKVWAEYVAYRRSSKLRKLQPASIRAQFAEFVEWTEPIAIEAIRKTIMKGWQGIFHPNPELNLKTNGASKPNSRSFAQRNDYSKLGL